MQTPAITAPLCTNRRTAAPSCRRELLDACPPRGDWPPPRPVQPMDLEATAGPTWLELERVLPLPEVTELTSLSEDSINRHHKDKIVTLSPRRKGMKLRHAWP
jgi:hypothetical protein